MKKILLLLKTTNISLYIIMIVTLLKNIIPNTKTYTKIHINELSRYTKKLSNTGYKCHYISGCSKL